MKKLKREESLWERLKAEEKPIVLYGTGNGADKILDVCIKFGIKVSGVFASAGFVRDRSFRNMKVKSLEELEREYPNGMTVLLCFGTTLEEVANDIRAVAKKHKMYIPEVPLYGNGLFDYGYYEEHFERIEAAEKLFCEERSRKLFEDMISFRLTGEPRFLADVENPEDSYRFLLLPKMIKTAIDCGAYRGDSAECMINALSPERIIAAEPDARTYNKLCAYAEGEKRCKVVPVNAAVGDKCKDAEIAASAGRGSGILGTTKGAKTQAVAVRTADSLADGEKIDLIKYDVEGMEWEALRGSEKTVESFSPALAVSVYHRTADLFEIPLYIKSRYPQYKLYLRRTPCIPAWDIVLFAVP